jgi:hypothetical protein
MNLDRAGVALAAFGQLHVVRTKFWALRVAVANTAPSVGVGALQ